MIAFVAQVAGIALAAGFVVSAIWPAAVRAASRLPSARRADFLVVVGALPMVVSACIALALVVPTALDVLGVHPDHCHAHDHGLHLCGVHGDVHAPLLMLGVVLVLLVAVRALLTGRRLRRASLDLQALEAFGARNGALVEVPGDAPLCLATGVLRPRVLLSSGLRAHLGPRAVEAALAHEHAHLRRRDPASLVFLQIAAAFGVPGPALAGAFRIAAEESADAEAAAEVGGVAVADALVRMARFMTERPGPLSLSALAFGTHPLEQRVILLLAGPAAPGRAFGLPLAGVIAVAAVALGAVGAEPIHHVIEDLLLARH